MLRPARSPETRPSARSRRSWLDTADCSMPTAADNSVTVQGAWRSRVRINSRFGDASACRVSATLTAEAASNDAAGGVRPSTPCPMCPLNHEASGLFRHVDLYMFQCWRDVVCWRRGRPLGHGLAALGLGAALGALGRGCAWSVCARLHRTAARCTRMVLLDCVSRV